LCPILLLAYINDFPTILTVDKANLYDDDTVVPLVNLSFRFA